MKLFAAQIRPTPGCVESNIGKHLAFIGVAASHWAIDMDTGEKDDLAALGLFRRIALENRRKLDAGDHYWQGLAFCLQNFD
jgi:hypothetical protein